MANAMMRVSGKGDKYRYRDKICIRLVFIYFVGIFIARYKFPRFYE